MATTKEIGYFNAIFVKSADYTNKRWHIEESRIKGGFNNVAMDLGVRAFVVDNEYSSERRKNAMIYSGIFNSKTGTNNLNQFPIGSEITKAVDIAQGSIQKLYSEDRQLTICQEDKTSYALIDKDIIYTAEGSPLQSTSNVVIGEVVPYLGKYGIAESPESFAIKGGWKYFADSKRGVVVRISRDGITEISAYGMRSYFKENLRLATRLIGMYDNVKDQYVLYLKGVGDTIAFDDTSNGWPSFFSYQPEGGFTLNGIFYTFDKSDVYQHYKNSTYNKFYGNAVVASDVTLSLNADSSVVKNFKTVGYEGTSGWSASEIKTDLNNGLHSDKAKSIAAYDYDFGLDVNNNLVDILPSMFQKKENKYFSTLKNDSDIDENEILFGDAVSGIKGMYMNIKLSTSSAAQELFTVSSEVVQSSK